MMNQEQLSEDSYQSLTEHLSELRVRLLWSVFFIGIGFAVAWTQSEIIFQFLRQPILPFLEESGAGGLIFTGVMDNFLAHIKVSLLAALLLSCPFWIYHVWKFVSPGLYKNEKKYAVVFVFCGTSLFLAGAAFVYFVVYPLAFSFLLNFGGGVDKAMISIKEYLHFITITMILFGLAFEMPLVLTVLGMMGVVEAEFLKRNRRYAIVLIAVLSATITPPDPMSMMFLMGPLILLYEASIILVKLFGRPAVGEI